MDPQGQYGNPPYNTRQHHITESPLSGSIIFPNSEAQVQMAQHHLAYQQIHQQQQQLQLQLQSFWTKQCHDVDDVVDIKNHSLPLARIKKIMKSDEDVRMISAETPMVFARACEMFILELTLRSWNHTEENKRRTLQRNDIAAAITRTDIFDFLVDVVPREDIKEGNFSAIPTRGVGQMAVTVNSDVSSYPYNYYMPPPAGNLNATAMMTMGRPVMDPSTVYGQQPNPYMAQPPPVWPNQTDPPPEDE